MRPGSEAGFWFPNPATRGLWEIGINFPALVDCRQEIHIGALHTSCCRWKRLFHAIPKVSAKTILVLLRAGSHPGTLKYVPLIVDVHRFWADEIHIHCP